MDRFDDDAMPAELRELRPTPRPEFVADLDQRAAAGFPRREPRAAKTPFAHLVERWRATKPRRRLLPVLATACAALTVATVVVAVAQSGGSHLKGDASLTETVESAASSNGGDEEAGSREAGTEGKFEGSFFGEGKSKSSSGAKISGSETAEETVPAEEAEESGGAISAAPPVAAEAAPAAPVVRPPESNSKAVGHRDIERSAYIVLGTKPGEVAGAAAKVYEAVHAVNGVVLHSSVQSGRAGATGASFELLIPSRKLDDALATFSSVAEVRQRHDATNDITAPTVGAAEELADSNASITGLLKELGDVETEAERESIERQLREERRHHAAIRASLERLDKRASMSEVSVRIVTDHGAGLTPGGKKSGSWGVGDALHDAGHILTIAAGILLIALAVLAPIALIALLIWLAARFRVRRLRERTLG